VWQLIGSQRAATQEIKTLKKKNTQEQNSRRTRLRLQEEEKTKKE
jgi:hypothetical protein